MGLCQKITADRVLADQIFIITNDIIDCDFPFAAASGATASGDLTVTVTELDFTTSGTALQVIATLMFQKELTVSGTAFAPAELAPSFPLEFKVEKSFTNTFCGVTTTDLANLGVRLADVQAQVVRIADVRDEFEFFCGTFSGSGIDDRIITASAHIEETVLTLLKVKLVTEEDLVVELCPASHIRTIPVSATCTLTPAGG